MHKMIMFPLLLLLSSWSYAQDDFVDSERLPEGAKKGIGQLSELDIARRTVTIGGIHYTFGAATDAPPVQIQLLGKSFGALQLLKDGMHVRFYYLPEADRKVIKALMEIAESTEIQRRVLAAESGKSLQGDFANIKATFQSHANNAKPCRGDQQVVPLRFGYGQREHDPEC